MARALEPWEKMLRGKMMINSSKNYKKIHELFSDNMATMDLSNSSKTSQELNSLINIKKLNSKDAGKCSMAQKIAKWNKAYSFIEIDRHETLLRSRKVEADSKIMKKYIKLKGSLTEPISVNPDSKIVDVVFKITDDMWKTIKNERGVDYFVQLYCLEEDSNPEKSNSLKGLSVKINSFCLSKVHATANEPLNIDTKYLKYDSNKIVLRFNSVRHFNLVFHVRLVALLTRAKAVEYILQNGIYDQFPIYKWHNLYCFMTNEKIGIPAQGIDCKHSSDVMII